MEGALGAINTLAAGKMAEAGNAGTTGQVLTKTATGHEWQAASGGVSSFNGRTGAVTPTSGDYTKSDVGLGNVDNTSDANKPVSTAQQAALDLKAPALDHYDGKDLTVAFATEIAASPYNGDVWAWLKGRLTAKNLTGIFVKDYISFTCKDNSNNDVTIKSVIAGINHDLGYNDTEITAWHIDFISEDVWPENHVWNKANYNNGIAAEPAPWCASDLKAFLNSASGNVPNAATADPATVAVNYSSTGVYDKLPAALKAVIVERRTLEPTRYSAGNLLTDDASWAWKDIGKLWIPNETEVYAQIAWGTRNGYSIGTTHQYPIFTDGKMRIKRKSGSRAHWWLRSAFSGNSTYAAYVNNAGHAALLNASLAGIAVPVCFRISA